VPDQSLETPEVGECCIFEFCFEILAQKNIFGAKFKNQHFADFDGIDSKLVYRVIMCADFDSDVYFILNPFLDGQLDHSKFLHEIQKWAFCQF